MTPVQAPDPVVMYLGMQAIIILLIAAAVLLAIAFGLAPAVVKDAIDRALCAVIGHEIPECLMECGNSGGTCGRPCPRCGAPCRQPK